MKNSMCRLLARSILCCLLAAVVLFSGCSLSLPVPTVVSDDSVNDNSLILLPPEPDSVLTEGQAGDADAPELSDSSLSVPDEDGTYTSAADVALYIHVYGHLPNNFISKKEAQALGWRGGSLDDFAPGKCIGGARFGNIEGLLPNARGRVYHECDIDTLHARSRGAKRLVFSNDGLIYYTEDHYESFVLLYGEELLLGG